MRQYTDWGLIYTRGRSPGNYRLYDTDALWCLRVIGELRGLGLTLTEIRDLLHTYPENQDPPGPTLAERLAQRLRAARARLNTRIAELEHTRARIDAFETAHHPELAGTSDARLWADDPRRQPHRPQPVAP